MIFFIDKKGNLIICIKFNLLRFASDLFVWCPENGSHRSQLLTAMYPLTLAAATENLADLVGLSLERYVGPSDGARSLSYVLTLIMKHSYAILTDRNMAQPDPSVNNIPQVKNLI